MIESQNRHYEPIKHEKCPEDASPHWHKFRDLTILVTLTVNIDYLMNVERQDDEVAEGERPGDYADYTSEPASMSTLVSKQKPEDNCKN